jgi:TRAP-type C4-dicarboxylate transport system substrate-binding protein
VTKKSWDKIPVDLRPKLLEAARAAGATFRNEIRGLSEQAIAEMEKRGLVVAKTTPAELASWQKEAEAVWPRIRGSYVPPDLFDEVIRLRNEYRAQAKPPTAGPTK